MTKHKLLSAVTAVLLGSLTLTALAQEFRDPFEGLGRLKWLLRGAELTPDQLAQISELRGASRGQEEQLSEALRSLRDQFDQMFTSTGTLDVASLTALQEQISQAQAARDRFGLQNMLTIRGLLKPEQLARVDETHQRLIALDAERDALPPTIAGEGSR